MLHCGAGAATAPSQRVTRPAGASKLIVMRRGGEQLHADFDEHVLHDEPESVELSAGAVVLDYGSELAYAYDEAREQVLEV